MGTKGSSDAAVGVSWVGEATEPESRYEVGMGAATGVPLACGVKFLSEGRINESGVFSPEAGLIDPKEFLKEIFKQLENLEKIPSAELTISKSRIHIGKKYKNDPCTIIIALLF